MKKFKKIVFLLAISVVFFCCKKNLKELPVLVDKQSKTQTCGCEQAYPGQGELVTFGKGDNSVTLRKIGNKYILDGDIILAPNQVELLRKRYDNTGGHNTESTFTIDFVKLWPGGVVYYTIDNNLPNQTRVTNAISHWEANTPITFVQRTNQTNYVTFVEGSGGTCGSPLGMSGGQQYIELVAGCSTGQTIHEIGHTIGLYHEQSRSDRDNFINIHYDNMLPDQKVLYQFKTYNQRQENGFESGSFDFNSIMMYGSLDFSIDQNTPLPVMTRVSDGGIWYGQRIGLSQGDIDGVNYLYGSPQLYARLNFNTIQEINESYYTYYSYHISVSFFTDISCTTLATLTHPLKFRWDENTILYENNAPPYPQTIHHDVVLSTGSSTYDLDDFVAENVFNDQGTPQFPYTSRSVSMPNMAGYRRINN